MTRASSWLSQRPDDRRLVAFLGLGEQRLAEAILVMGDEAGGDGENMGAGAIVAFEADDLRAGKIMLEAQDIVDIGAAPAVDRLVVVADAAEIAARLREKAQPEILNDIGVLIFVDENIAKPLLIVLQDFLHARETAAGIRAADRRNRRR